MNEKRVGPYRGFGFSSLISDIIWQYGAKENYSKFETFNNMVVNTKTLIVQMGPNILNVG